MSEFGIYDKINFVDDPPNIPADGKLYVAVFYRKTSVVMCLTGLYWGENFSQIVIQTIHELTRDPEDMPRLMFELIPWADVEMIVVLGRFLSPPEAPTTVLTTLTSIRNDGPCYHPKIQMPTHRRDLLKPSDVRYQPYQQRCRTPATERNEGFRANQGGKPFWENFLTTATNCFRGNYKGNPRYNF